MGRKPARRPRLGERADQAVDRDRLGLAAQRQLAGRLEGEAMPRERMGGLGYQDRSRGRGPEEAGGGVHGVAGHLVGRAGGIAEAAGHDRAGVDGDVQGHRLAEPRRPFVAQRCAAGQHVERGVERPLRIVLVSDRRAEDGEDGIAHELLDEAVVAGDRLGERLEQRVLERAHLLGIEALGERGEIRRRRRRARSPVRRSTSGWRASGIAAGAVLGDPNGAGPAATLVAPFPLAPPSGDVEPRASPQRGQNAKSASHAKPHARQGVGCRRPQRGQKVKCW